MDLNINRITEKITESDFMKNFIIELNKEVEKLRGGKMEDVKLTSKEQIEFERKEFIFLQEYFEKELSDLSKGEIFIVTNKYEDDKEYHRYKVTQYKNNLECKYIAFEKDLPNDVQLGDIVRKINGRYIFDSQATQYVKKYRNKIKQDLIENRSNTDNE